MEVGAVQIQDGIPFKSRCKSLQLDSECFSDERFLAYLHTAFCDGGTIIVKPKNVKPFRIRFKKGIVS